MPVMKVNGGYRWGSKGKVYPTRQQAEKQGAAARAAGYRGRKKMASPKPKKKRK